MVATESQLFTGYLIIEGVTCYFVCARFGDWQVHSSFAASDVKGLQATRSFSESGHEVRMLVRGQLYRFGGLDEATSKRLAQSIGAIGGEATSVPERRHPVVARKRLAFSDAIAARPAYTLSESESEPEPELARPSSRRPREPVSRPPPPPPPRASPPPIPPVSSPFASSAPSSARLSALSTASASAGLAFPSRSKPKPFGSSRDEGFGGHDENHEICDDDDDFFDDDDDDDDDDAEESAEFAELLARMDVDAEAEESTRPASPLATNGATVRPFIRGIAATFVFVFLSEMAGGFTETVEFQMLLADPEIGPFVWSGLSWALIGATGGLVCLSFGRTLALAFAGCTAGAVSYGVFMEVGEPWVLMLPGWFILSWAYMGTRGTSAALLKAGAVAGAMAVLGDGIPAELGPGGAVSVGIFWLLHGLWEKMDMVGANKAEAS